MFVRDRPKNAEEMKAEVTAGADEIVKFALEQNEKWQLIFANAIYNGPLPLMPVTCLLTIVVLRSAV